MTKLKRLRRMPLRREQNIHPRFTHNEAAFDIEDINAQVGGSAQDDVEIGFYGFHDYITEDTDAQGGGSSDDNVEIGFHGFHMFHGFCSESDSENSNSDDECIIQTGSSIINGFRGFPNVYSGNTANVEGPG